ncbi:MAG: aminofutalosine synthase MqnE [Bdellovibrionota bacterium]|nr:MAG: aminofutalosine synthase MqnE [Bdellovibrionota bacterium]
MQHLSPMIPKELMTIAEKVRNQQRLSFDDGLQILLHPDLLAVGQLANLVRERLHGDITYYNKNLHLNATNVCEAGCLFCSFARLEEGMPSAYTMSLEQAKQWIEQRVKPGMTEIHIVNGLNPNLSWEYYLDLLRMIRSSFPQLHIKAFTAVEIHYFSEKYGKSYAEVLEELVEAGLGSLPGGGAEIFAPRARRKLCGDKVDADGWLEVHRVAHTLGLYSNCTMLYGTIERPEERVDHLMRLRSLQDETGGFQAFIPLAYHPENNRLGKIPAPTATDDLRLIALSRLMLDNIPHIKAYWVMLGVKVAQLAQRFGSNDMDGTVTEEKIYHMAGSASPNALTESELRRLIESAGRRPVERSTTYQIIEPVQHAAG